MRETVKLVAGDHTPSEVYAGLFLVVHGLAGYIKHPWPCSMSRPSQRAFKTGALNASVEEKWLWS